MLDNRTFLIFSPTFTEECQKLVLKNYAKCGNTKKKISSKVTFLPYLNVSILHYIDIAK